MRAVLGSSHLETGEPSQATDRKRSLAMNRKPAAVLGMVALVAIAPVARAAPNLSDPCYGPTRPLTQELRKAFVDEIGPLAKRFPG